MFFFWGGGCPVLSGAGSVGQYETTTKQQQQRQQKTKPNNTKKKREERCSATDMIRLISKKGVTTSGALIMHEVRVCFVSFFVGLLVSWCVCLFVCLFV